MIGGNTEGVRDSILKELEALYELEPHRELFIAPELLHTMAQVTGRLNRELSAYIGRDGSVIEITIGDSGTAPLTTRRLRRSEARLSGIRCVHTHPGGSPMLSDVDIQALRMLKFDAMCAVSVLDGEAISLSAGFLGELKGNLHDVTLLGPVSSRRIPHEAWLEEIRHSDTMVGVLKMEDTGARPERAMLVSVDSAASLKELEALADTAGAVVVDSMLQRMSKPDNATYMGSGKAKELMLRCQTLDIDLLIADDELTASQQKNLEEAVGVRVVDRTALILDIFAQRAHTREGKLQVELAQLKYQLPRLMGMGTVLSRLAGGIGTRGPGESKLEYDRRHIRMRMRDLSRELKALEGQRGMRRQRRVKAQLPVVALVGYTNAGKSTLLNALCDSDVFVEDKLFATLDPVSRHLTLPERGECVMVDTVGFVNKLPHEVVEAFKSTLEEALYADLLVVVSDGSSPEMAQQRKVVGEVLSQLGAAGKPVVEVLNKQDVALAENLDAAHGMIPISATEKQGLDALIKEIARRVLPDVRTVTVRVPFEMSGVLPMLHKDGKMMAERFEPDGAYVTVQADSVLLAKLTAKLGAEAIALGSEWMPSGSSVLADNDSDE